MLLGVRGDEGDEALRAVFPVAQVDVIESLDQPFAVDAAKSRYDCGMKWNAHDSLEAIVRPLKILQAECDSWVDHGKMLYCTADLGSCRGFVVG